MTRIHPRVISENDRSVINLLFVGGLVSYLRYLCLFVHSGVQNIVLCFCFVFLRLVYLMLPVSLDSPFLIAPTVFSNVYVQ